MALFFIYAAYSYITADNFDYDSWKNWVFNPINTTLVGIFTIAVLFHAWIGMRDVVLDYVHHIMLRIFVLGIVLGVLIGSAMMVFSILLLSVVT
jgi:succinate dehydrogenase / fumarate reductase membrane anchor subunit